MLTAASIPKHRAVWPTIVLLLLFSMVFRVATYDQDQVYLAAVGNLDDIGWGVALTARRRKGCALLECPKRCLGFGSSLIAFAWFLYAAGLLDPGTQWMPVSLTIASAGSRMVVTPAMNVCGPLG